MRDRAFRLLSAVLVALCFAPAALLLTLAMARSWRFPELWPVSLDPWIWVSFWSQDAALTMSAALSVAISACVAAISTLLGYIVGGFVAYHRRRRLLTAVVHLPYVISPAIAAISLLYVYLRLGLAGGMAGVILAQLAFTGAFAIIFFLVFWNQETRAFMDLTRTLGGTDSQVHRRVLLPLARQTLTLCFFQTFLISWFQYALTLLIGSGRVRTLPLRVYDYIGEANIMYAALGSCLLTLPPVLLLWAGRTLFPGGRHVP